MFATVGEVYRPDFDEAAHRYSIDGHPVPGVSEIMSDALGEPSFGGASERVLERKRTLGTAAHLAWHLDDLGRLDPESVHGSVFPFLEAWRSFRADMPFDVLLSEERICSVRHGFAGTPDRFVRFRRTRAYAILDGKTGIPGGRARMQTAAYAELVHEALAPEVKAHELRRFAIRTMPDGRFRVIEYDQPGDWRDFLACLIVHRIKREEAL